MSKIKNGGLNQDGAEPFERQQFGTAGVEGVNIQTDVHTHTDSILISLHEQLSQKS